MTTTASIGQLDSYFISLINDLMTIESRPLDLLEQRRDSISLQSTAYQSLNTHLNSLQDITQSLISTDAFYSLTAGRTVGIAPQDNDDTVLTAKTGSSAGVGEYEISVTQLAEAQRQASAVQATYDQALGLSGTFWLGGTGTAAASVTPNSSVTGVAASAVGANFQELGTQTYSLEIRDNDGTMQFRLKDVDGNVLSIADQDDEGESTTSWQNVTAGATVDTGRGLSITFGAMLVAGTTTIDYTAAGTSITVATGDSLLDISGMINDADQPQGREIHATVVGTQLVLTAENTGTAHTMIYSDGVGLGFTGVDLQQAKNAIFSVNDISFTRSSNIISDVLNDVTFNLASDAEGKTAMMTISSDMSAARSTIESFVTKFNETLTYIEEKTSIVELTSGTYSRGALSNDSIFSDLRSNLLGKLMSNFSNSGQFNNLRNIGIKIDDSLRITITDSDALDAALENDFEDLTLLFDSLMTEVDTSLGRFTGTSGYLTNAIDGVNSQLSDVNTDIEDMTENLTGRQQSLVYQYAQLQTQLNMMSYTQQIMNSISRFV